MSARNENRAWLLKIDDTSEAVVNPFEKFESLFDRKRLMIQQLPFESVQSLFKLSNTPTKKLWHPANTMQIPVLGLQNVAEIPSSLELIQMN